MTEDIASTSLSLTILPHTNAMSEKPLLTDKEEIAVRAIYAAEIVL